MPIYEGKHISFENYMDEFMNCFRKAYDCVKADSEVLAGMCQPIMKKKVRYLFRNTQEYYMYIISFNFPELMRNQAKRQLSLWHMNKGLHTAQKVGIDLVKSIQSKHCLAGMAHGYSGMAVAMALLGSYTGEEKYKEIVLELFSFIF